MPQEIKQYKVLISTPSDTTEEVGIVYQAINAWNSTNTTASGIRIEPVFWKTHTVPEQGMTPQEVINRQLENCDMLLGFFWTRLGTPTKKAQSGSVEEIEKYLSENKPVSLYFSNKSPSNLNDIDTDQLKELNKVKEHYKKNGLIFEYNDNDELLLKLGQDMTAKVNSIEKVEATEAPDYREDRLTPLEAFESNLNFFVKRFKAEWKAEEDSEPLNVNMGQETINRALPQIFDFNATCPEEDIKEILHNAAVNMKKLLRHRITMGRQSFDEFWIIGNEVIKQLESIAPLIIQKKRELGLPSI